MSLAVRIEDTLDLLEGGKADHADVASHTLMNQVEIMKALEEIQDDLKRVKKTYPAPGFGPG